jgi:hypothetical protein
VVRADGWAGPGRGQRFSGARVRGDPPAAARGLVDRVPDDRVTEREAQRDVGGAHDARIEQFVESGERIGLRTLRDGGDDARLERLSRDGGGLQHGAGAVAERLDLLLERGGDGGGHLAGGQSGRQRRRRGRGWAADDRAVQLLEVERVAPRVAIQRIAGRPVERRVGDQLVRVVAGQRTGFDPVELTVARGDRQPGGQRPRLLPGAVGDDQEHRRRRSLAQQVGEQLERRVVGPVQVVQREDHRRRGGQRVDQESHGAVGAKALARQRVGAAGGRVLGKRREDPAELARCVLTEAIHAPRVQGPEVVVQRVDEDVERHVALELGRAAAQSECAARLAAGNALRHEARLADAGLARDLDDARATAHEGVERTLDRSKLRPAADEHVSTVKRLDVPAQLCRKTP